MPTAEKLNDLRKRILADEDVSRDEVREAITALRGERLTAHEEVAKKTSKRAPAVKVDLDDLL